MELVLSSPDLRGIIPAIVTPMNEKYEVEEDDLRSYARWIARFEIGGLAVNVDTGEGPHLSDEERKRIISIVSSVIGNRVPIVAGVPPASTRDAGKSASDARESGANALLVFPHPFFYGQPLSADLPYNYHRAIAMASRLPIVLFQLQPALGGYELTEETLLRLIEIPEVVAIKEALFDAFKYYNTLRILRRAPRKITMLTGNDNFICESLILGAEGALIGFGTLATDQQVEMHKLVKKKRFTEAMEIWENIRPLEEVIFGPPVRDYRARTKVALYLQGVIENVHVRPPLSPVSESEMQKVREALVKAGVPVVRRVEVGKRPSR